MIDCPGSQFIRNSCRTQFFSYSEMIRVPVFCCLAVLVMVANITVISVEAGRLVKRSPQMPAPPGFPDDLPMPPMPGRVVRQAPQEPPKEPPMRLARQAPPEPPKEPPKRVAREALAASPPQEMFSGLVDVSEMLNIRRRREAKGGAGHLPTKTG